MSTWAPTMCAEMGPGGEEQKGGSEGQKVVYQCPNCAAVGEYYSSDLEIELAGLESRHSSDMAFTAMWVVLSFLLVALRWWFILAGSLASWSISSSLLTLAIVEAEAQLVIASGKYGESHCGKHLNQLNHGPSVSLMVSNITLVAMSAESFVFGLVLLGLRDTESSLYLSVLYVALAIWGAISVVCQINSSPQLQAMYSF